MTQIPEHPEEAARYAAIKRQLMLADLAFSFIFLVFLQASGVSRHMAGWWEERLTQPVLLIAGYLFFFGILYYLANLPLHFYNSFSLEHRFKLSRMSLKDWCIREMKQMAVGGILGFLLIEALYWILRASPAHWPFWATLGWVCFSVILARIFPTVLLPIFYKTTPVEDEALVDRLLSLCRRVDLPALGVFRFDLGAETRKANAALAGLGKTRRVLLSDTLIKEFTPGEIEGVLGHELAHHRYHHITLQLVLGTAGSLIAFLLTQRAAQAWIGFFKLSSLADIAGFPLFMAWLSLLGFAAMPVQNGISRIFEWQCDRFATAKTNPQAFADALKRLGSLNLADPNPPAWVVWLFYDHPPITERIRAAGQTFKEP